MFENREPRVNVFNGRRHCPERSRQGDEGRGGGGQGSDGAELCFRGAVESEDSLDPALNETRRRARADEDPGSWGRWRAHSTETIGQTQVYASH